MSLLPRRSRSFAGGGSLGYESQLGAGLSGAADVAGKVGDALYQNLPPLAVPFVSVKRADLDGVRADISQELSQKAAKLGDDLAKLRDKALEKANMTAAGKARVVQSFDGFMTDINQRFTKDPALLASPSARTQVMQDYERAVNRAFIQSNVNGMVASDKIKTEGADYLQQAAYDAATKKRLNVTLGESIQQYQENPNASVNPFNLTYLKGKESDGRNEWQTLINNIESSTFSDPGKTFATVHRGTLRGAGDEQYDIADGGSVVTTSNANHINAARQKLIGYDTKDAKGKTVHVEGNWQPFFTTEGIQGLLAPRQEALDNQSLRALDQPLIQQLAPFVGNEQAVGSLTRRQLLQRLESVAGNTTTPPEARQQSQQLIAQLEANRDKMANQQVTIALAEPLGLKLKHGSIVHAEQSANRVPVEKDKAEKLPGSTYFNDFEHGAAGETVGETYETFRPDGRPVMVPKYNDKGEMLDAQGKPTSDSRKAQQVAHKTNTVASPFSGSERMTEAMDKFILAPTQGANGEKVFKNLSSVEPSYATMIVQPGAADGSGQKLRVVQGGTLGKLLQAQNMRITGHDGRFVYAPNDPNQPAEKQAMLKARLDREAAWIKQQIAAGVPLEKEKELKRQLDAQAAHDGFHPMMQVQVRMHENDLEKAAQHVPGKAGFDKDKDAGVFGYYDNAGKPVRPDQFTGTRLTNTNDAELAKMGFTRVPVNDKDPLDDQRVGLDAVFTATMLIPVPNLQLNESSKTLDAATAVDRATRQQAEANKVKAQSNLMNFQP